MHLTELYIYPIKSLGGISLQESEITSRGLALDRRWMLVDENGVFLSQRDLPGMCLLDLSLRDETIVVQHQRQGYHHLMIPINKTTGEKREVVVWRSRLQAELVDPKADEWFSKILGRSCQLVWMPEDAGRKVNPDFAKNGELVSFADGYQFLILGQATLNDLNRKLESPADIKQFRPNFVFTGGEAYEEDHWGFITIGEATFFGTKPCGRCTIITIDPRTAEKGSEPLKTLNTYRKGKGNMVYFGQYLISEGKGSVKLGDKIEVHARKEPEVFNQTA